jgi:hypothetical protein
MDRMSVTMVNKADRDKKRPRDWGRIREGKIRHDGIPAAIGREAVKPAEAGERPLDSKILGSQFVKPWEIAKVRSPMINTTWTFRTLISLVNIVKIPASSLLIGSSVSFPKNHQSEAIMKVNNP